MYRVWDLVRLEMGLRNGKETGRCYVGGRDALRDGKENGNYQTW